MKYAINKYWILLSIFMVFSCKEDHEIKPATYSLLLTGETSKSWVQTSFTFIFDDEDFGEYDANLIYGVPDCALDDIYTFIREGKQLEVYEGNDKCDAEGDDLIARTSWEIVNANASLFLGGGSYDLSKLTDDSLVYGFRDTLIFEVAQSTYWELPGVAQWVYKPTNE